MKVKNISYPHPILGNEDDVKGSFEVKFKRQLSKEHVQFTVDFNLRNKELQKLIKNKSAMYTVEIECRNTFYRQNFSTFTPKFKDKANVKAMRGKITVRFYIRATKLIENYKLKGCHEDYAGFEFSVNKCDILALGGEASFFADKTFDPLKPSVSSLMKIQEDSKNNEGPMTVDYDGQERIIIKLSVKDWKLYTEMKSMKLNWIVSVIHSSIVLPVLAEAIAFIDKDDDEKQDYSWFQSLKMTIERKNLSAEEPLTAAQDILENPVNRCFSSIVSSIEGAIGED